MYKIVSDRSRKVISCYTVKVRVIVEHEIITLKDIVWN